MAVERSWWRRVFGLDGFDVAVHAVLTAIPIVWIFLENNRREEVLVFSTMVLGTSLIFLAIRRRLALNKSAEQARVLSADRVTELEQRVAELEYQQARMAELEERLDFTERLLARSKDPARELAP